jgi:hypothetical protein
MQDIIPVLEFCQKVNIVPKAIHLPTFLKWQPQLPWSSLHTVVLPLVAWGKLAFRYQWYRSQHCTEYPSGNNRDRVNSNVDLFHSEAICWMHWMHPYLYQFSRLSKLTIPVPLLVRFCVCPASVRIEVRSCAIVPNKSSSSIMVTRGQA